VRIEQDRAMGKEQLKLQPSNKKMIEADEPNSVEEIDWR
jgi:hypothetical protein